MSCPDGSTKAHRPKAVG